MKSSSLSEHGTNIKHSTIRKCPACGTEVSAVQKMGELLATVKNVDNYVKDKRNRIINCA